MQPDVSVSQTFSLVVLVDDDPVQNHVNKVIIRQYLRPHIANIVSFTDPLCGLEYIKELDTCGDSRILLFIDINMPVLSGWAFLQRLSLLDVSLLSHFTIYMLSSSIDPADKAKASGIPLVKGYITKPLTDHLQAILARSS